MKELIFRAMNKESGNWLYSDSKFFKHLGLFFFYVCPIEEWVIQQYVGIRDKKKILLYEGDVVWVGRRVDKNQAQIEFSSGGFCFRMLCGGGTYPIGDFEPKNIRFMYSTFKSVDWRL